MDNGILVLLLAPLAGAAVALVGTLFGNRRAFVLLSTLPLAANVVVLAGRYRAIASGAVLTYHMGGFPPPFAISFSLDGLAWLISALVALLSALIALASLGDRSRDTHFFFFFMMLVGGLQGVVLASDLFNLFVCFEIVALSVYVLIAWERNATGLLAAFKYLILSSVGMVFYLFGVFLVYREIGSLSMARLAEAASTGAVLVNSRAMHFAAASFCVGIGVRTAFIPFHTWLPEAHAYAPHPISAMLSGVVIKVSFFAIVRILGLFVASYFDALFLWIGAATAFLAVLRALAQTDAKKLLAYHSISQMGYVLAAFGAVGTWSTSAAVAHAVNHALFKSLLFLTVGYAVASTGERNLYRIPAIGRRTPIVAACFFVASAAIAAIPPFNGFASKQLVASTIASPVVYYLLQITGAGTVASFIKLSRIYSFGRDRNREGSNGPPGFRIDPPGAAFTIAAGVLALTCIVGGLFGERLFAFYLSLLTGDHVTPVPTIYSATKLLSSAPVVAAGIGIYFLATSHRLTRFWKTVRSFTPDLRQVLLFFFAGLVLFAVAAM